MTFNFCSSHHDVVIKHTIYDLRYATRMPTWSNFKNKHDEGIMPFFCSHENSVCVQVCRDALFAQSSLKKFYQPFK